MDVEEREDGLKPYLFTIETRYGEFVETSQYLEYSSEPEKDLARITQEERGGAYDEGHGGYWFDGQYLTRGVKAQELSPQEAVVYLAAMNIKNQHAETI